jgi:hypothetical protein
MKSLLALLALGLLCVGVAACGGSSKTEGGSAGSAKVSSSTSATVHVDTTSPAAASPSAHTQVVHKVSRRDLEKYDRDEDDYIHLPDDSNSAPLGFTPASTTDKRAITALVKSYYAAALRGDGAGGCSLIEVNLVKAIPLDYGKLGPSFLRPAAHNCPAVMSLYFRHEHRKLSREVPQMQVVRVSVKGEQGVAIMRFGPLHERFITQLREHGHWMISAVLDGELE